MSEEEFNDKEKQFNDLWEGATPNGVNRTKALKFRQYILEHVRQMKKPLTRDNALKYWMGILKAEAKDSENF
jgi:CRISPR/Cas system-associated endonuclease Cas3-HD